MILYFAPLLGLVDQQYLKIWEKHFSGVDRIYGPFLTFNHESTALSHKLLQDFQLQTPYVPQFLSSQWSYARRPLEVWYQSYARVNWNLGCPYPRIIRKGRGAGLLESPEKVADFLKSWSLSELGKISIKLRLGVNKNCSNTLIPLLHSFPTIDEIILHPRRAIDYYHGPINQKAFFPWKKKFGDRMVWSGEVWNTDQALELLKTLGSDTALMLGRGLVGDPGLAMKIRGQQPEADRYRHFFNELINVSSEGRLKEFSRLWEKQMHPDRAFWETFRRTRDRAQLLTMLERFKKLL